jgi:hypothetical protein
MCGVALVAMSTAGFSHWWSVQQFAAVAKSGLPLAAPAPAEPKPAPVQKVEKIQNNLLAKASEMSPGVVIDPSQQKFFEAMVAKMENLQNQNRDLLDQVAETNRDVMKLEFRVDTHSESFRPMPVSEERFNDMSYDDSPGVLPPRAEPVFFPSGE